MNLKPKHIANLVNEIKCRIPLPPLKIPKRMFGNATQISKITLCDSQRLPPICDIFSNAYFLHQNEV